MGPVHLFDDFVVKTLHGYEAGVHCSLIQQVLQQIALEGPEDVACPEVDPGGGGFGGGLYLVIVKFRKAVACLEEGFPLLLYALSCQFHFSLSS